MKKQRSRKTNEKTKIEHIEEDIKVMNSKIEDISIKVLSILEILEWPLCLNLKCIGISIIFIFKKFIKNIVSIKKLYPLDLILLIFKRSFFKQQ